MNKTHIKLIFAALFLVMSGLLVRTLNYDEAKSFTIGANQWVGYESIHLAELNGQLRPHQFRVVEFLNSSSLMQAFEKNIVDVAALTLDEAIMLTDSLDDLVIFLVLDVSSGGDAILTLNPKWEVKDMKGRIVGVEDSAVGSYLLSRAAEINNVDLKEINIIPMTLEHHEDALKTKKIDFVVTFYPVLNRLQEFGARSIFNSNNIPNEIVDVLVTKRSNLKKFEKRFLNLSKILLQNMESIALHQPSSLERIRERNHINHQIVLDQLQGILIPVGRENSYVLKRLKESAINRVSRTLKINGKLPQMTQNISVELSFVEKALMMEESR